MAAKKPPQFPLLPNKNFKILTQAESKSPPKMSSANVVNRNPLSDLSENILHRGRFRTQSFKKSVQIVERNFLKSEDPAKRSKSTSGVEEELNYCFTSRSVTKRRADEKNDDSEEVFVSGVEHYINYVSIKNEDCVLQRKEVSQKRESKIVQTAPAAPAKKITLVRKFSNRRSGRFDCLDLYENSMYDADYCKDNFELMLTQENSYVFRVSYLKKYIDEDYRRIVINWLIYAHQVLALANSTLFITIRMFDHFLIMVKIPTNIYVLSGITCMWIANKMIDSRYIRASKLFALCGEKYSKNEFYDMERKILKVLNFDINYPDLSTFLYYYLKTLELENNEKIRNGAMFVMECSTLLIDFSASAPSILAATALYSALLKFEVETSSFLAFIKLNLADEDVFRQFFEQVDESLRKVLQCKCACTEVVAKYSTEKMSSVAQKFFH